VREWNSSIPLVVALVTADGRYLYVVSEASENYADLGLVCDESAVLASRHDPGTGSLTRIANRSGCLGAAKVPSCRPIAAGFLPKAAVEVAGGGGVVLALMRTRGVVLGAFERNMRAHGALTPISGPGGCASRRAMRRCARLRGLCGNREAVPSLVTSTDRAFLYAASSGGVAMFRVTR
jgi:hypothetical protein